MRRRTALLAALPGALGLGVALVALDGDDPDPVVATVEATSVPDSPATTRFLAAPTAPTAPTSTETSTATSTTAPATTTAPPPPPTTSRPPPTSAATPPQPPAPPTSDPRIAAVTAAELGASWRPGCPVGPDQLRRITVTHRGFDGRDHTGHLVVHVDWAEALLQVFDRIHAAGFPIERIEPVSAYGGSDDASMAANNTSAFNCRRTTNGTSWSRHSYGRAIDVNPIQNPYVLGDQVLPPASIEGGYHVDRSPRPGVITPGDPVVTAFAAIGWQWGGSWTSPVDHQHFDRR